VPLNHAHLVVGCEHAHVQGHGPHHRGASTSEQPCCAVLLHDPYLREYSHRQLGLGGRASWGIAVLCSKQGVQRLACCIADALIGHVALERVWLALVVRKLSATRNSRQI
jgi:hypothetical protein